MFTDDQLLPISALQHFEFCQRRAALIHLEGLWAENRFTAQGNELHRRAHDPRQRERRGGVQEVRGLELRSYRWGLSGKADVVELHDAAPGEPPRIVVVEYKRGRPRAGRQLEFRVQLAAQALCLEEMLGRSVSAAALFFGKARRREPVALDDELRARTAQAIAALHALIRGGRTPLARYQRKCERCSLKDLCLPRALRPRATAQRYLDQLVAGTAGADWPGETPP